MIGCFLGLVVAWAWSNVQESGGFGDSPTMGADEFERLLGEGPMQGHPRIKNITLHHDKGHFWVTMKVLRPDPKDPHPKNPRRYRYVLEQLNATTPFMPDFREFPTQTVMLRINPSAISKAHSLGRHEDEGALALWVNGAAARVEEIAGRLRLESWKIQTGQWADPGASAQMALMLRAAHYDLMIVLSSTQEKPPAASELTVKFNDHDVPLTGPVPSSSGLAFKGSILRDWFVNGDRQAFEFSRATEPVRIWEVRLIDPTYSVADYLAFLKQTRPDLNFGNAWWETGWIRFLICAGIGGVLFAGLGPLLVLLFIGAQRRSDEPAYDLDRFKGEQKKQPVGPTAEEELDLSALEAKLTEGVSAVANTSAPIATAPTPAPKLTGGPDAAPPDESEKEPEEYQGEFYPVARHSAHKHDPDQR